jgi:predicted kinase
MRTHYPRTPHLPWSPGVAPDDVRAADLSALSALAGREVVVTEKLDGENTTLYPDGLHARSLDSGHHPSRAWVKALHGRIAGSIPPGWRVCGENMYARHSIAYDALDSWFYAFSVWAGERCLDWDATVRFARRLGVPVPPVLWRGVFDERAVRALRVDPARQEGYVVRTVEGFDRAEFAHRVAKWVRPSHVQTDTHWMLAPVVPNGRGPTAALWDVRSGAAPDAVALRSALAPVSVKAEPDDPTALADVSARLDLAGRTGEQRLAGVLAVLLSRHRRAELACVLPGVLGMPLARRVADLVGLHTALHRLVPDERRRAGLVRMSIAADLAVLHAVAASVRSGGSPERDQVEWSTLHAEDAGLLGPAPLEALRAELRKAMPNADAVDAADRCFAEAVAAYADGRLGSPAAAGAYTWRWRNGAFPRLIVLTGPAGSGKSRFTATLSTVDEVVSMDDLRSARGNRADQRANAEIFHGALDRLDAALTGTRTVVWDATSLTSQQRSPVHAVARRRDALVTHAVLLVPPDVVARRNAGRANAVPDGVLAAQLGRFSPPYPFEAHRTWYVGTGGTVDDTAGTLAGGDD